MNDRKSEPTAISEWIDGPKKEPWPPTSPAPGVVFRRIKTGQNSYMRTKLHRDSELVPYVEDEGAFYRNCPSSRRRRVNPGECPVCKGARFCAVVRRGEFERLFPTGRTAVCPRCHGSGRE